MRSYEHYIQRCLSLALKGVGHVSPNPMVGAVLVYKDNIIGEGFHEYYGYAHAEVNCIQSVKEDDKQYIEYATLYVSLEPCCHYGKTPPCVDYIIAQKIKKVVVACTDISAKVNGKGIALLRDHGIEVVESICEKEAIELNKRFFTFHQKKRPYIILKWAQSKEGFIGKLTERVLLTDSVTNTLVHQWRAEEDAIWVGYNTARIDDPQLNVRHVIGRNPVRVVYDPQLELSSQLHLFDQSQPTLHFNTKVDNEIMNVTRIRIDQENYIHQILSTLYTKNRVSILVEGGRNLLQQLIDLNLWDEARCIQTSTSLSEGIQAPLLKQYKEINEGFSSGNDVIHMYKNNTSN